MTVLFNPPSILTVRIHAGLNADSFLAGLLAVTRATQFMSAQDFLLSKFPDTQAQLTFSPCSVQQISGFSCRFSTPPQLTHRSLQDISDLYAASQLSESARELVDNIWRTIAQAEARVHACRPDAVHFHEVGRLSNVLAIGLIAELFTTLNPQQFIVSPIPLNDGAIHCAHGIVPNPAPALLAMLDGVTVRAFSGQGEAITPTGLAILLGLNAQFGSWPNMRIRRHATAFVDSKYFPHCANGTIFALGDPT